jgi:hypothetical protein
VHYCAETFSNDGTLANLIMKTVKRTMAAEYSRELGVKVLAGQKRLARLGFKQGGIPGYGLRRMLMSADLYPKQELADGERKSITTDRVILVPGPVHELQSVRDIYRMLISDKLSVHAIASELNRQGVKYLGGSAWGYQTVYAVLTHPKYAGCHVFNRTSSKLYTRTVRLPKSEWVLTPGAFKPIIDHETFSEAQRILQARTIKKSDEEVLESLRVLLASEGRLSLRLIKNSADVPSPSTYRHRFGGLRKAYQLIGYGRPDQFGPMDLRRRTQALREDLLIQIATLFPNEISIVRKGGRWRPRLRMKNGRIVTVLVARSIGTRTGHFKWQIDPIVHERHHVTLLALLDASNSVIQEMYVLSRMDRQRRFKIAADDDWLRHGELLKALAQFPEAVKTASRSEQRSSESHL